MRFPTSITFYVLDLVTRIIFPLLYTGFFHFSYKLLYIIWMHSADGPGWISAHIAVKIHSNSRRVHNAYHDLQGAYTYFFLSFLDLSCHLRYREDDTIIHLISEQLVVSQDYHFL